MQGSVQAGGNKDNVSAYVLYESAYDRGWRDDDYAYSSCRVRRVLPDGTVIIRHRRFC